MTREFQICRECWEWIEFWDPDAELCDSRAYARSLGAWLLSLFLPIAAPAI